MTADEAYICDLCDDVLGQKSIREYTFPRRSDQDDVMLSVAAFYPESRLAIELQVETTSYDVLLREQLLAESVKLIFIDKRVFAMNEANRLQRDQQEDRGIVEGILGTFAGQLRPM